MADTKKSLCIFIHFSEQQDIPHYVTIFVNELSKYFDDVILSSNPKVLKQIPPFSKNVTLQFDENYGYDFGRFYAVFKSIEQENYNRIACINDSNILINSLENILNFENIDQFDFWGVLDSNEKPWFLEISNPYHIQSHFLIFNQEAINVLEKYFRSVDMTEFFREENSKLLRYKVINHWEFGVSQFMESEGLKIGHYFDCNEITDLYKIRNDANISHKLYEELLLHGYPMIKKKVLFDQKSQTDDKEESWKILIRKYGHSAWELDRLIDEIVELKNEVRRIKRPGLINKIMIHLHQRFIKYNIKLTK